MVLANEETMDISVVMPCLNEEGAVGFCVTEALNYIYGHGLTGEVIVVDNGCTDNSANEAIEAGATLYREDEKGYGSALRRGISESRGRVIIFGDCDATYDFSDLTPFYEPLSNELYDVMIGDRLGGVPQKGAMQLSHIIGVHFLSAAGRARFGVNIRDFHCGIRGLTREAAEKIELNTSGMEFATEFIAQAARSGLSVGQTAVNLRKSIGDRDSKLNPVRDGLRHLFFILRG